MLEACCGSVKKVPAEIVAFFSSESYQQIFQQHLYILQHIRHLISVHSPPAEHWARHLNALHGSKSFAIPQLWINIVPNVSMQQYETVILSRNAILLQHLSDELQYLATQSGCDFPELLG